MVIFILVVAAILVIGYLMGRKHDRELQAQSDVNQSNDTRAKGTATTGRGVAVANTSGAGATQANGTAADEGDASLGDAQYEHFLNNYNYLRAVECIDQNDDDQAYEYLRKAIADDPGNGYAHLLISDIAMRVGQPGVALNAVNRAIELMPHHNHSQFLSRRARINKALGNKEACRLDATNALALESTNASALCELIKYYNEEGQFDESDLYADLLAELQPHDPYAFMMRGVNHQCRYEYDLALEQYEYVCRLAPKYTPALVFCAEIHMIKGDLSKSIDLLIKATEAMFANREQVPRLNDVRNNLAIRNLPLLEMKFRAKIAQGDHRGDWLGMLALAYSAAHQYVKAARCYYEMYQIGHDTFNLGFEAFCWNKAGNLAKADQLLTMALAEDPDNMRYMVPLLMMKVGQCLDQEAIELGKRCLEREPDNAEVCYALASVLCRSKRYDEALVYIEMANTLYENRSSKALMLRGMVNHRLGRDAEAMEDLELFKSNLDKMDCSWYLAPFMAQLGREDLLNVPLNQSEPELTPMKNFDDNFTSLVDTFGADSELDDDLRYIYYLRATLRLRQGDRKSALADLRSVFEYGETHVAEIRRSMMLQPLWGDPEFEQLLGEYEQKLRDEWLAFGDDPRTFGCEEPDGVVAAPAGETIAVPFERQGALCKVPCQINSLPLHFVFDTGASDVTISTVEATFMLKNGYLRNQDLSGREYYMTASGEIAEGTKVRLRQVDFGGLRLSNVRASVVQSQTAPLLLGQSVLQQLGRIEIDNDNRRICLTRNG